MSFGGHAAAMISSLKNNRLLLSRRSLKERRRNAFSQLGDKIQPHKKLHHKKATKEETEKIKFEIREDNDKLRSRNILLFVFLAIIGIAIFYSIYWFLGI